jgi:two-component system, sensor histidine kinase YesM
MQLKKKKIREFVERYLLLRDQSFMKKLFVFASLFVILPVLSVGVISYQRSAMELEEEVKQSSSLVINQVESHIEYYLQDFEVTSLKIMNSKELAAFIDLYSRASVSNEELDKNVRNYLVSQEFSRPDISNITILSDNGKVIDTLGSRNFYPAYKLRDEYWYSSVPRNGMIMLVSRTLKLKNTNQPVISLVRRLYNPRNLQPIGMLVIDINFRRIEDILKKVTISNKGFFFILDTKGHYVYHPDYSKLGQKVENRLISNLIKKDSGSQVIEGETKDLVTYTHSSNLGWTFFTSVEYRNLLEGINEIRKTILVTICIALMFAYLTGYGFATTLIRPIRRLQQFMKKVEIGKLDGRVKVESKDEIGQLTRGFNNTVEKLSKLVEEVYISKLREAELSIKQKEIEIKMLQSQMNPHFLYNTLETIRGMALEENRENIAMMSNSLGKLLRYNLRNNSSTVTLSEELKFCEVYLQIQKVRFEDRFSHYFEIPEWAIETEVVKFSLQPLVENCFIHANGSNATNVTIIISVIRESENAMRIIISDNGMGIKEKVLEEITRKLKQTTTNNDGLNIGIINVHQRIRYLFGDDFGISIHSSEGAGTRVEMRLPIIIRGGDEGEKNLIS